MSAILSNEDIAEEFCEAITSKNLTTLREEVVNGFRSAPEWVDASKQLQHIFTCANIIRLYRMGLNPELFFGRTEAVYTCKRLLGLEEIEAKIQNQKSTLHQRGFL